MDEDDLRVQEEDLDQDIETIEKYESFVIHIMLAFQRLKSLIFVCVMFCNQELFLLAMTQVMFVTYILLTLCHVLRH